jgi:hypothetical protein
MRLSGLRVESGLIGPFVFKIWPRDTCNFVFRFFSRNFELHVNFYHRALFQHVGLVGSRGQSTLGGKYRQQVASRHTRLDGGRPRKHALYPLSVPSIDDRFSRESDKFEWLPRR